MEKISIEVTEEMEDERIDKLISNTIDFITRSYVQKLLKEEKILVAGNPVKANYRVNMGDLIEFSIPESVEPNITPEDLSLDILYEDDQLLIVNKPKGMVVHPAAGHYSGTLVNGVMYHCKKDLSGINGVLRPGIVHRIDKDTTGSVIVCKTDTAHNDIAAQLKVHSITRRYRAVVHGVMKEDSGRIEAPIGRDTSDRKKMSVNHKQGKHAVTHYRVLKRFKDATYVECELETGRTHQIRVHLSSIGHPLLGDTVYGRRKEKFNLQGQTLHAYVIGFIHPITKKYLEIEAPLPAYFIHLLEHLE